MNPVVSFYELNMVKQNKRDLFPSLSGSSAVAHGVKGNGSLSNFSRIIQPAGAFVFWTCILVYCLKDASVARYLSVLM